jgi:hypothetical protein
MVNEENKTENKIPVTFLTVKSLGAIASLIVLILGSVAGAFGYIDNTYVSKEIYEVHVNQNDEDLERIDEQTAALISAMQLQNQKDLNQVYMAIRDASALPLIVRRDTLLARGSSLSNQEKDELNILNAKLDELNVQ